MHSNPGEFADLLEAAADDIDRQPQHPGQSIAGVWPVTPEYPPEVLIGMVAAAALARVCKTRGCDLDKSLASYVQVSKNIALTLKGAPDQIAAQHLRDAAAELRRLSQGTPPKIV